MITTESPAQASPRPISLVIIDDTPDVRLLLRVAFRRNRAFTVVGEAADGQEGIEVVRRLQPDAVLLDLAMPVMDGLTALPIIREVSPGSAIVVLSAFEGTQMGSAAISAGAAAYVQKGASPSDIITAISSALGVDVSSEIPTPSAPATTTRAAPVPVGRHRNDADAGSSPYALLVEQAVDHALAALDADGRIESWNAGAERLFGYRVEQVLGLPFAMLYPSEDRRSGVPQQLLDEAATSRRATHSRWLRSQQGSPIWGDVVVTELLDPDGMAAGFALAVRDRTEQRREDEAQASLFASVSHDLRTPLTAIRAFASLIDSVDAEERAQFAARIDANAEQLQTLVNGLFDYAKIRAGATAISLEPIPLNAFARLCVGSLSTMLNDFRVEIGESAAAALADRAALRRVLDNLLSNAAKYSPPGTRIAITFAETPDRVQLAVHDQGRGIDPGDVSAIFGEFVRGRLAENDGGTGLGLASVRQLVALQGGSVWIESELGRGTTVTVDLARV